MNIPNGFKLVPVEPTCDMLHAGVKTSGVLLVYEAMLAAAPTPPQPIYDEAKRIAELERALAGMLFAFDDGVGLDWSEDLLDFARKLTAAKEFKAALKPAEPAKDEHVCTGCGSKGWTANCAECVPY